VRATFIYGYGKNVKYVKGLCWFKKVVAIGFLLQNKTKQSKIKTNKQTSKQNKTK
jgi:hypothetical protein